MLSIPTTATMGKARCSRTDRLLTKPSAGSLLSLALLTAGSAAATHSATESSTQRLTRKSR